MGCATRRMKCPVSLSKLKLHMDNENKKDKIAVVVGSITNDPRLLDVHSGLKVCALRFTETARKRLTKAGAELMTFDQLAMKAPLGKNCILLRGPVHSRTVERYFGKAP